MKKLIRLLVSLFMISTFAVAGGHAGKGVIPAVEPIAEITTLDEGYFYVGIAYGMKNFTSQTEAHANAAGDTLDISAKAELEGKGMMLQAGYKINEYFALEGRYWLSSGDLDSRIKGTITGNVGGAPVNDVIDVSGSGQGNFDAWGIYLKPIYPITEILDIYALLGYGNVEVSAIDENDFQWGAGVAYTFSDNLSIFIDYVRLHTDSIQNQATNVQYGLLLQQEIDRKIYTINLGLTYCF